MTIFCIIPHFQVFNKGAHYSLIAVSLVLALKTTVAEKCKTNHNSENKITNYKRKCKSKKKKIRKHNNNSENIITSQKTQ